MPELEQALIALAAVSSPGVLERLRLQGLSSGIARELRKHVAILEREIAELE